MPHSKGYKPDHVSKRDILRLSHEVLGASPSFPPADSNEHLEGTILDQNDTSGCTGHGTSQALEVNGKHRGAPLPFRPSPRSIYVNARVTELAAGQSLEDNGAEPIDVVATIASKGIRPLVEPSPLGFASDVDTSNVNALPTDAELAAEKAHLEPGPYRIATDRADFIDQLCAAIHTHGAACTGSFVDTTFENYTPATGPVKTVNMQDPNGGGHWLAVTSYRTVTEGSADAVQFGIPVGKRIFRGPNSWGPGWGDAGHYEVVEDVLVTSCSDAYGFETHPTSAPSTSLIDHVKAAFAAFLRAVA